MAYNSNVTFEELEAEFEQQIRLIFNVIADGEELYEKVQGVMTDAHADSVLGTNTESLAALFTTNGRVTTDDEARDMVTCAAVFRDMAEMLRGNAVNERNRINIIRRWR